MTIWRRGRVTVMLVAVATMLAAALVMEVRYLDQPQTPPTAERPVVTGEATYQAAVRTAASVTAQALSYGHEDLDAQVAAASAGMTDEFAVEYREATEQTRARFTRDRATQEVRVAGSAVVTASDTRATALLFLDQYLAEAGSGTTVTGFRALVSVTRQDGRWLVSDIRIG